MEADHVIIVGVNNVKMGILSMIVDDSLLSLVSPNAEPIIVLKSGASCKSP